MVVVEGTGAVDEPVPPEAAVYQSKFVPVAVSGLAAEFWQYETGVLTAGAAGAAVTQLCASAAFNRPRMPLSTHTHTHTHHSRPAIPQTHKRKHAEGRSEQK